MKVKSESEATQSCSTPSHPMDCSLPGSSVHGILQARVLEWGAIAFSKKTVCVCVCVQFIHTHIYMSEKHEEKERLSLSYIPLCTIYIFYIQH